MSPIASVRALEVVPNAISERAREKVGRRPLWEFFEEGQALELSGCAPGKFSIVARLMQRAQQSHEVVAYVTSCNTPFPYAPDLVALGVDLNALICVRMPAHAGSHGLVRAAEVLLRSGAFGLVVLEFGTEIPSGELAWQARLTGLVRHHATRLVLMTSSSAEAPSLGPMVSLRIEPHVKRDPRGGRAVLEQRVLKSKLGFSVDPSQDIRRLPEGAT
jgi:recombination protein RecA